MTRALVFALGVLTFAGSVAPRAVAQEKPAMVPLKLDLVISRQAGEKKISNMPYTLWLTANAPDRGTSLRMGVQVPVPTTVVTSPKEGAASEPVRSYTYRNIGTNIDVSASTVPDGRYGLLITLNESGVNTKGDSTTGAPVLRDFTSRFYLLLRDGQTATYTSATDPVTGETLKVDVTLAVLK